MWATQFTPSYDAGPCTSGSVVMARQAERNMKSDGNERDPTKKVATRMRDMNSDGRDSNILSLSLSLEKKRKDSLWRK